VHLPADEFTYDLVFDIDLTPCVANMLAAYLEGLRYKSYEYKKS